MNKMILWRGMEINGQDARNGIKINGTWYLVFINEEPTSLEGECVLEITRKDKTVTRLSYPIKLGDSEDCYPTPEIRISVQGKKSLHVDRVTGKFLNCHLKWWHDDIDISGRVESVATRKVRGGDWVLALRIGGGRKSNSGWMGLTAHHWN